MLHVGLPGEAAMARYADYEVLGRYLAAQKKTLLPMTFSEVARIVGRKLPNSAKYPAWWSNDPSNNPMTRVWLKAGFKTEQVDTTMQRLVFRRVHQEKSDDPRPGGEPSISGFGDVARSYKAGEPKSSDPPPRCRHPLYGALKGYIRIMPGVDLTEPADPEWGNRVWGDDTK